MYEFKMYVFGKLAWEVAYCTVIVTSRTEATTLPEPSVTEENRMERW